MKKGFFTMSPIQGITLLDREPFYRGGFTDIYKALYRGEEVALKRLRVFYHQQRDGDRQKLRRRLTKEALVWQRLCDQHVLEFLGVDSETFGSDMCVVSPWMRHGTILQYRKTHGASNINIDRRLHEISLGIDYLHLEGIVHGDLRGTNILIDGNGKACIADFGLTDFIETLGDGSASHYQGSTRWLAPELIHPDDFGLTAFQKTRATDIYAFAYVILEIFTGNLPFVDIANDAEVIYRVIQGVRPRKPVEYNDPGVIVEDYMWDMVERCWEHHPSERMTITDVLRNLENWNRGWNNSTIQLIESTIAQWVFDKGGHYLCWIENSGSARTTLIARLVAEICAREGRLAASIFFTLGPAPNAFFQSVLEQLVQYIPTSEPLIRQFVLEEPSLLSPTSTDELQELLLKLIVYPMIALKGTIPPKVIVVDALELCGDIQGSEATWFTVEILIQSIVWLAESLHRNQLPLRICLTSKADLHRKAKRGIPKFQTEARSLYLYEHSLLDSTRDAWGELHLLTALGTQLEPSHSPELNRTQGSLFFAPDGMMSHILKWFDDNRGYQVCWLKYPVGQYGRRSMVAQLIEEHGKKVGALAASIFCSTKGINSRNILPTLALQLGNSIPVLKPTMEQIIQEEREVLLTPDDHSFARKLIIEPFLTGDLNLITPMVIVVDCIGSSDGNFLLTTLVWLENAFRNHAIPLQIFVTSEPELYTQANLQYPKFMDATLTLHLPRFESWTASAPPSESLFVNQDQKIYKKLISFLALKISADHSADQRLCNDFQAYLDRMTPLNTVRSLVESQRSRLQLLQISTQIQVSEHPYILKALREDEASLGILLEGVLNSDVDTQTVLTLKGDDAHSFLTLLETIMSKGLLGTYEAGRKARRLLVKLSETSEIIPASVLIRGLTLVENQPVSGGGFADIYRARYQGQEVALKHLRVRQDQDSHRIRRAFGREALVWQQLKHPSVLTFLGIDSEIFPSSLCMVSPWMKHGTILDLRAVNGPSNINIERRLIEIAGGLEYLHAEGVIHGDLRGANILVDNDWHAVLSDFGLTVFGDATAATHTSNPHGSIRWMAPELLNPEMFDLDRSQKTHASDVYSFACVCLEIYTGHHPFVEAANDAAVIYRIMQGRRPALRVESPGEPPEVVMPDYAMEIVEWCWKQQPAERPEIMDVVQIMKTWVSMMSTS
ncbi:kinase-like domain-containing protein [Collybia nuda]|uniref:Kinase-like domain-containing protein n=1 Tax=Collybia nuda TaxID=64659 RepID=A0A9P6CJZ0_9AGAR|nr:kinase-like domain-containing protein [Collybia nuda]